MVGGPWGLQSPGEHRNLGLSCTMSVLPRRQRAPDPAAQRSYLKDELFIELWTGGSAFGLRLEEAPLIRQQVELHQEATVL